MALPRDGVVVFREFRQRVVEQRSHLRSPAFGGQLGDLRPVVQAGLEDAAYDREVEFARADEQARQEVEPGMAPEVADGGGITLTHLDQAGRGQPLERFPDRGARHPEHLGKSTLTGQRLAGLHLAA